MEHIDFLQQNWYWAAMAVFSGGMFVYQSVRGGSASQNVSPMQATLMINREDALIIDVRDPAEFNQGHIPNARHIPLKELMSRQEELRSQPERPIIINCHSGGRSIDACMQLRKAGFTKVFNLEGGLAAWQQAGQPVTRKRK